MESGVCPAREYLPAVQLPHTRARKVKLWPQVWHTGTILRVSVKARQVGSDILGSIGPNQITKPQAIAPFVECLQFKTSIRQVSKRFVAHFSVFSAWGS